MWNFHGSILPEFRGASPLDTALAEGKQETGITLMGVILQMDAGPIADIERFPILGSDHAPDIRKKGAAVCPMLLERNLDAMVTGTLAAGAQDADAVSYCRKLEKEDGFLDFNLPADVLERRFRACDPWPGTSFQYRDQRYKVGALKVVDPSGEPGLPGVLSVTGDCIQISTAEKALQILELQRPGGKMLQAADFLRGNPLESGTELSFPASKPWVCAKPFPRKT
jgi:methionyl-tRNA formyltransferase